MGCCADKLPSKLEMAANAIAAGGRALRSLVRGDKLRVSERRFAQRMERCVTCIEATPHAQKPQYFRCGKCGCWLNGKVFAKARLASEKCPLGRWEARP